MVRTKSVDTEMYGLQDVIGPLRWLHSFSQLY